MNAGCCECHKIHRATHYRNNQENILRRNAEYAKRRPEVGSTKAARYRAKHPERVKETKRKSAGIINANTAKRRAMKHKATPPWSDLDAIKEIYARAKRTGMHVDHLIPLCGRLVCGLHVPENLQLLAPVENFRKSNKFNPDEHEARPMNSQCG
jgi:hypothetical protein